MLIFAGLNEGIFPNANLDHRYFHPYTRTASKLKSFDTEIGFMEYDFINSLFNENVVLSYSDSLNTKAAKCRWLEKMMLSSEIKERSDIFTKKYRHLLQKLHCVDDKKSDNINYVNIDVNLRPSKISVSGVERLMSNPYCYYAKYIAKLDVLEDIARTAGPREFGIILHEVIANVACENSFEDYVSAFHEAFYSQVAKYHIPFAISRLWSVRLQSVVKNLYEYIKNNPSIYAFNETPGGVCLSLNDRQIELHCVADRIELYPSSYVRIIDYKTGYIPSTNEVNLGIYPQLAIEKFILLKGGFKEIETSDMAVDVLYLDISGKLVNKIDKVIAFDVHEMEAGLKKLLEEFLCSSIEFFVTNDVKSDRRNLSYRHLMRQ
jgi:ATP-dependent helicase/nuclease subunit B